MSETNLLTDETFDVFLLLIGRFISHQSDVVGFVFTSHRLIVVGRSIVLHNMIEMVGPQIRIQCLPTCVCVCVCVGE